MSPRIRIVTIAKNTTLLVRALIRRPNRKRTPTTRSTERNSIPLSKLKVYAREPNTRKIVAAAGRLEAIHSHLRKLMCPTDF
jgi:hypothetical protein